jgi:hypothetical protein
MHGLNGLHAQFCASNEDVLHWPPDVFGFSAHFAKLSGIYTHYTRRPDLVEDIGRLAKQAGKKWRKGLIGTKKAVPRPIREAWAIVCDRVGRSVEELKKDDQFTRSVLYLLACADEACVGVGIPDQGQSGWFDAAAELLLSTQGNLCRLLPQDTIRVLPKLHTPQSGLNIRSLSHHLAICSANEVRAEWTVSPISSKADSPSMKMKILLAPWPLRMGPDVYKESTVVSKNPNKFGYFDYAPSNASKGESISIWLRKRLDSADNMGHQLDLVVFPECAMTLKEWRDVSSLCAARGIALVSGVHHKSNKAKRARNSLKMRLPLVFEDITQDKHHRWQLDEKQIRAYSLSNSLNVKKLWWENIEIEERKLHFVAASAEVTMCSLICEDLARQDPVSELVRAVGPNLVIALLSDGPQINGRWPSRYASVLADDPGCSVLTISSLGMVERSRPKGSAVSRTVASWKDALGNYVPIDLGVSDDSVLIDIEIIRREEWSADGRSDGEVSTFPTLVGIHGLGERSSYGH